MTEGVYRKPDRVFKATVTEAVNPIDTGVDRALSDKRLRAGRGCGALPQTVLDYSLPSFRRAISSLMIDSAI
jgi:hypothetical protein